jgi:hypothetical protein
MRAAFFCFDGTLLTRKYHPQDCGDTWVFFDGAATCDTTKWHGGTGGSHALPCPKASADPSLAVIAFGTQPITQLSLDYLMQEDYAGGLASHANAGKWIEPDEPNKGMSQDGWFRNSLPFEPLCNCPETGDSTASGLLIGYSQMWESAVMADMWDQLIFIGGDDIWTADAATYARQSAELRPAFRRKFASAPRPRIAIEMPSGDGASGSCLTQHTAAKTPGGPLRAAVWTEVTPGNASAVCGYVVVINTALDATLAFRATLSGGPFNAGVFDGDLTAARLYAPGPTLNVSRDGGMSLDFIAPGQTNIYRIGCTVECDPASGAGGRPPIGCEPANLATPLVSTATPPTAGWSVSSYVQTYDPAVRFSHARVDPRLHARADNSVRAAPARHSLRVNVPTAEGALLPFRGQRLFPNYVGPWGLEPGWAGKTATPGDKSGGGSMALPGGRAFRVELLLQASPCGTAVTLMGGGWRILHAVQREASQDMQGVYEGAALAVAVYPCGTNWTTLSVVVHPPPANATHNGTALQLRLAPPPTARGWGATVWLGAASVVELNTGV